MHLCSVCKTHRDNVLIVSLWCLPACCLCTWASKPGGLSTMRTRQQNTALKGADSARGFPEHSGTALKRGQLQVTHAVRHCCRGGLRRSGPHTVGRVDVPKRSPNSAVALESGAEGNLPNPVAALHPNLRLDVGQYIPAGHTSSFKHHELLDFSVDLLTSEPGAARVGLK